VVEPRVQRAGTEREAREALPDLVEPHRATLRLRLRLLREREREGELAELGRLDFLAPRHLEFLALQHSADHRLQRVPRRCPPVEVNAWVEARDLHVELRV